MKNKKYWEERFRQLEASQHHASEKLTEEIQRQMLEAEGIKFLPDGRADLRAHLWDGGQ